MQNRRRHLRLGVRVAAWLVVLCMVSFAFAGDVDVSGPDAIHSAGTAPRAFRNAEKKIQSCIVTIESFGGVSVGGGGPNRTQGISKPGEGPTTGVIISAEGHIITSTFNFLRQPPIITVVLNDGQRCVAKMLGRDDTRKVCMLKIDVEESLPTPELVDRTKLKVGQWAISLGVGYGNRQAALSAGIISALNRMGGRAVQTDANISPANYGGPLVDLRGRLIGICVPLHPSDKDETSGAQWYDSGIGFAVPLSDAQSWLDLLKTGKSVEPAFLGVAVKPHGEKQGVVVAKVQENSPAAKAGLKEGDLVLKLNDRSIIDVMDFTAQVKRRVSGEEIELTIIRDEEQQELALTLAAPPKPKDTAPAIPPLPGFDLPGKPKLP